MQTIDALYIKSYNLPSFLSAILSEMTSNSSSILIKVPSLLTIESQQTMLRSSKDLKRLFCAASKPGQELINRFTSTLLIDMI